MQMTNGEPGELDLAGYREAQLKSEQARIIGMLLVFLFFIAIGAFRIAVPLVGSVRIGLIIVILTAAYLLLELWMLFKVRGVLASGLDLPVFARITHGVIECLYPVLGMALLIGFSSVDPYVLLVSPLYAFILVLLALSILRLDLREVLATGIVATAGHGCLVFYVFVTRDVAAEAPGPAALYINQTLMLVVATGTIAFITIQVRRYVFAAVREMETRRERDVMQRHLEVASEIQRGLLPETMPTPAGYEMAAFSRPAAQAGGDYYDWQAISDHRLLVSLADVTGHGVGPALVTAACRGYVRASTANFSSAKELLERLNTLLHSDVTGGRYVTFALLDIDLETNRGNLLCAGHAPTFFLAARDELPEVIAAQGVPLGILPDTMLDDVHPLSFEVGDLLLIFSDGIHELTNVTGEHYGLPRLEKFMSTHRTESAQRFLELLEAELDNFRGKSTCRDDMTAIVVKRRN